MLFYIIITFFNQLASKRDLELSYSMKIHLNIKYSKREKNYAQLSSFFIYNMYIIFKGFRVGKV